jgi:F-type H+-transporting ATPase subunit delta
MTGRLAKRYARALRDLAREQGTLEACGEELTRVVTTFGEPRLEVILNSPAIDREVRFETAKKVAAALSLSKTVSNLIALLAERERLHILPEVARWYENLIDQELGRVRVTIRSATQLGAAEKAELTELAKRLTRSREVVAATEVDPELLGGVIMDVGGTVYDGSLRAQLARLTKDMAETGH